MKTELLGCLRSLEAKSRNGADGLEDGDQVTLRRLVSERTAFEDSWERIDFLARLCLLFHKVGNATDAANTFRTLAVSLKGMVKLSKYSESMLFLDNLLKLEQRLSRVITDTQSDPAAILGICLHVLLANAHTARGRNLTQRRAKLLNLVDAVLEQRFTVPSWDAQVQKSVLKLRKLRADTHSIPLTLDEIVAQYFTES